jgi:RNA polymerase sigma-70 factor (ECF subfamily)
LHSFGCALRITHSEGDALDIDRGERLKAALARAVGGDQLAFAEIVTEHQAMVFSIGWHYLQDRSLAEDVAQEVFWELYQKLGTIQSPTHLTYWLRKVAVHRSIDQGRKQKHRSELDSQNLREPAAEPKHSDPLLLDQLRQAVAMLQERQRMVVVLRYEENLGPAEIAELMEIPVNTVKSTLHRALEQLRKKLTRKVGESRYAFL